MPRGSKPGERRGGRAKGTPNHMTADIKAAIENAFTKLGGEDYLVAVARKNPAIFCQLLGRVLPKQLEHSMPEVADKPVSALEAARRVAYLLSLGALELQNQQEHRKEQG